jgi:hypothetical protein
MCRYYYRVTVNDQRRAPTPTYPSKEQWERIGQTCEDRGWEATLERQYVFSFESEDSCDLFLAGLCDPQGYIRFKNTVACPWEVLAEMKPRTAIIIGE